MSDGRHGDEDGFGLADAIAALRGELLAARAAGADVGIQLPVESMTVALHVVATRTVDGKAGFDADGGRAAGREDLQPASLARAWTSAAGPSTTISDRPNSGTTAVSNCNSTSEGGLA